MIRRPPFYKPTLKLLPHPTLFRFFFFAEKYKKKKKTVHL
jgi:hypothetical protein